jgi:hypothetical protein
MERQRQTLLCVGRIRPENSPRGWNIVVQRCGNPRKEVAGSKTSKQAQIDKCILPHHGSEVKAACHPLIRLIDREAEQAAGDALACQRSDVMSGIRHALDLESSSAVRSTLQANEHRYPAGEFRIPLRVGWFHRPERKNRREVTLTRHCTA